MPFPVSAECSLYILFKMFESQPDEDPRDVETCSYIDII